MSARTAFGEKNPVRRIFLRLRLRNYVLANGHRERRKEELRGGGYTVRQGSFDSAPAQHDSKVHIADLFSLVAGIRAAALIRETCNDHGIGARQTAGCGS